MPAPEPLTSLLRTAPAFAQLSERTRERIASLMGCRSLAAGEFLAREGDIGDELFLVLSGSILISRRSITSGATQTLGTAGPGQLLGELSWLTGQPRSSTMQAAEATAVQTLPADHFDRLCSEYPEEMASTIAWMADRLDAYQIAAAIEESPLLHQLPAGLKQLLAAAFAPQDLIAGHTLYRAGDPGDALYLILGGRIRLTHPPVPGADPASSQTRAELGKGEVLGELALLANQPRSTTAVAIRDTHLARLDRAAFDRIVAAHPAQMLGLFTRHLAMQLRDRGRDRSSPEGRPPAAIAVLPLSPTEQTGSAREFASELVRQLSAFGPTLHLNRAVMDRLIRPSQPGIPQSRQVDAASERRLLAWLDDMEMLYRHVVYEADYQTGVTESAWTARCLRRADVLLAVASGPGDPQKSEQTMLRLTSKAIPTLKTTLVLVHTEGPGSVSNTATWKKVLGFTEHEHVRRDASGQHHPGDVGRIARALNRQSVGLVLGGGFALGLAHIGVIDAMRELNIPIDYVGGTSMGAIIAAAVAQEYTHAQMLEVMDKGCAQALKGDYTLPLVSLLTGRKVNLELGRYLEGLDIEDLWLPYFAISASLVQARMIVHRQGSALRSVLASCRAPGMFPPLGWNGDVLVDGGLVNNIPADIMRQSVAGGTVFAADVSPNNEFTAGQEFGMDLSGWRVARRNFNPFRRQRRMGTLADVLMRLIRLGGVAHNQQIRASADLYLSLPLDNFSVRDFHRGEEMSSIGYRYALQQLQDWIARHGRPWQGSAAPLTAESPVHPPA